MYHLPRELRPVKPERPPFRPLRPPPASYWTDEAGGVYVLLVRPPQGRRLRTHPLSAPTSAAPPSAGSSRGGESYDVLANGGESSCGLVLHRRCKHLQTTFELLELGVLAVAPGSAGDEEAGVRRRSSEIGSGKFTGTLSLPRRDDP